MKYHIYRVHNGRLYHHNSQNEAPVPAGVFIDVVWCETLAEIEAARTTPLTSRHVQRRIVCRRSLHQEDLDETLIDHTRWGDGSANID